MDSSDGTADPYPDDTVTIDGQVYGIPHTPERVVIAEVMRGQGTVLNMTDPRDWTYRRPLDTLDDAL